ncbi:MAG: DUF4367 domain-containing protein [Oscillibacter sp.]|nr:DUF4367 domain-containing protein [Oscillibacter sp.]
MTAPQDPRKTDYAYLRQLSQEKLLELLCAAPVPASTPEEEAYVDALEEAIIEKEQENPTGFLPDAEQQWEEFQKLYFNPEDDRLSLDGEDDPPTSAPEIHQLTKGKKAPVLRRALIAAAIVAALILLMIPAALGYENIFHMIGTWTSDTFRFAPAPEKVPDAPPRESSEDLAASSPSSGLLTAVPLDFYEYENVQEFVDQYGITAKIIPNWMPEGYAPTEIIAYDSTLDQDVSFYAVFECEDKTICIGYNYYYDSQLGSVNREKDDSEVQIYVTNGIIHYLYWNLDHARASWYNGDIECDISADVPMDQLVKMIDSIYE